MSLSYAKAVTAAITAFLGLAATRNVELGFWVEGLCLAAVAALTVYTIPNRDA